MSRLRIATLLGLALFTAPAPAAEEPVTGPWSGKLGFGLLRISGNTDSESLNADVGLNWDGQRWHHQWKGRALGKKEAGSTTAEAYKLSYDVKYDFRSRAYLFGLIDYNRDRFGSYAQQIFEALGVGWRLLETARHRLQAEAGAGATQNELLDGARQDRFNARASADYRWTLSDNASFSQSLAVNWSADNIYTEAVSELRAGLVGKLGMSLSFTVKNNSAVLPGTERTDTWTALNIDYAF